MPSKKPAKPNKAAQLLGKRGGEKLKALRGPEYYREIGKLGGQATKELHRRWDRTCKHCGGYHLSKNCEEKSD